MFLSDTHAQRTAKTFESSDCQQYMSCASTRSLFAVNQEQRGFIHRASNHSGDYLRFVASLEEVLLNCDVCLSPGSATVLPLRGIQRSHKADSGSVILENAAERIVDSQTMSVFDESQFLKTFH